MASARGYGDLKVAVGEAVAAELAPLQERYVALREDEAALEAILAAGAAKARAIASSDARRRARGDGRRPAARCGLNSRDRASPSGGAASLPGMTVASLELDLEVFSGPFDLLLTLVLREEVDLLEVQLADVVLAYLDHLEGRGELDLEVATEFLVLIAALLELKSRLMLPREDDDLLDLEPGEAAEELLARMLEARRYRRAADHLAARLAGRGGRALPLGAAAAGAAAHEPRRRRRRLRPAPPRRRARRPAARAAAAQPRARHGADDHRRRAPDAPARAAAPRRLHVRRGRPRRRSRDGRRHAVRAARALQAGRGDVDAGGGRSATSRSPRPSAEPHAGRWRRWPR